MIYIWLAFAAFIAFVISTVAGGGGSLILIPIATLLIGAEAVAPVVSLGTMVQRPVRLVLFWKSINWNVVKYYVPSAVVGSFLGAYLFSTASAEWLQIILGIFLISTIFQYRFGEKERSFPVKTWFFLPLGFAVSFFSGLIGATGPVLNPFYINAGIDKQAMIGTKTANSFLVGLVKLGTYSFFGALAGQMWWYGLMIGAAAGIASYVGKRILSEISSKTFRQFVIILMVVSGAIMIWDQRDVLVNLFRSLLE
jgi:uncharacterized membrane protein YfcA